MSKINYGAFKGEVYEKFVNFSQAVLWKDRQISLPPEVVKQFKPKGVKTVVFIDEKGKEKWTVDVDTLRANHTFKQEGQEPQYYFPISIFKIETYE